ncbi:MAG: hypothetical protein LBU73_05790 [Helicobacteraceae bacterium]|jgi:hypothetical protein|nr:hypothetical protein [Helicobacteraceae bacterium]
MIPAAKRETFLIGSCSRRLLIVATRKAGLSIASFIRAAAIKAARGE